MVSIIGAIVLTLQVSMRSPLKKQELFQQLSRTVNYASFLVKSSLFFYISMRSSLFQNKRFIFFYSKFINKLIINGQKDKARLLMLKSCLIIRKSFKKDPFFLIFLIFQNLDSCIGVRTFKKGSQRFVIPYVLSSTKRIQTSLSWFLSIYNKRKKSSGFCRNFISEFKKLSQADPSSISLKKRILFYKKTEASKSRLYL